MLKYLLEIQNKFILSVIMFFSTLFTCYWYKDVLLFLLTQMHLGDENLYFIFTDVTELFAIYIRLVFFFSMQLTIWYGLYQLFSFLRPALYSREFKFIKFLFYNTTFFWILTGVLTSYILVPFGWNFFLGFQTSQGLYFEARLSEYFNFYFNVYFLCLIYCQLLSLLFFFLADIPSNYLYVRKYRKLYYYVFLLFSTCVTPPDLVSQLFITTFVVIFYEVMLLLKLFSSFLGRLTRQPV
jgi:sec-independent protein translocase protein TatC